MTAPNTSNDHDAAAEAPPLHWLADFPPQTVEAWRKAVEADLEGADFNKKLVWQTYEGIAVQPLYTRGDLEKLPAKDDLPGFAPYTRGTRALHGVDLPWQIRQDCLLASPEEVNAALRDGLARGQTALGIRLDNAARRGLDGDNPEAAELAGRGGCTLSSINGLRLALQDIDLARIPITIRTGTAALPVLSMLLSLADERRVARRLLTGGVEFDPLRDLVKNGTLRAPLDHLYREASDMAAFCQRECPGIRAIMVNSHPYHNAGSSAVEELACTLAAGAEYLAALKARGLTADAAALAIMFSFSVGTNFFMEIAKLRAARALWTRVAEAFGARDVNAGRMFMHVRTSTFTKTVHDPYNNLLRSTIEAMAGGIGGSDSLYVAPFDETLGRPDEFSMRMARNQQLLLQEEAHLSHVVDPAAGSYYVEALTDALAREAWALFQRIEAEGGLLAAVRSGMVQRLITGTAQRRRQAVTRRRDPIVGVSNYANPTEKVPEKGHIPRESFLAKRRERLQRLKAVRHQSIVRQRLDLLARASSSGVGNLLEIGVAAAAEGATLGEMIEALNRGAKGESVSVEKLASWRASQPFERLRARTAAYAASHGGVLPKVLLLPMGPLGMRKARASFCLGFFGAGGFDVVEPEAFKTPEDAAAATLASNASAVVLCSDDPSYPVVTAPLVQALRAAGGKQQVYIAGYPEADLPKLKEAGAQGFVHIRADVVETLSALMDAIGLPQ